MVLLSETVTFLGGGLFLLCVAGWEKPARTSGNREIGVSEFAEKNFLGNF